MTKTKKDRMITNSNHDHTSVANFPLNSATAEQMAAWLGENLGNCVEGRQWAAKVQMKKNGWRFAGYREDGIAYYQPPGRGQ